MPAFDAIVVLGGGISPQGELSKASFDRISVATDLYYQGIANRIIVSGRWWHRLPVPPVRTEADAMKEYAENRGVVKSSIFTENKSEDTIGNAYFTKTNFLEPNGWRRIAMVTCHAHLFRASTVFRHILGQDYQVVGYPTLTIPESSNIKEEAARHEIISAQFKELDPGDSKAIEQKFSYLGKLGLAG